VTGARIACLGVLLVLAACARARDPYVVAVDVAPWLQALGSEDVTVSDAARARLLTLGPAVLPALAAALDREPPAVRTGVVDVLSRLEGADTLPLLLRAAHDTADEVRFQALLALALVRDPRARPVVEGALADPVARVRCAAAGACAAVCASPAAIARLVEMALDDEPFSNAAAARRSLEHVLADPQGARAALARDAIAAHARPVLDRDAGVARRARAALLVADAGDAAGSAALVDALRPGVETHLRLSALYALGTVGDGAAVAAIVPLLDEAGPQPYAVDALRRMAERGVAEAAKALDVYHGPRPSGGLPPPGG
jgi:HEAT repeat protein